MTNNQDKCGHPTRNGTPCQNPATDGDTCWLNEHGGDSKPSGRDPKLTRQRQEEIAQTIEQGGSINEACRKATINKTTFYNWLEEGEHQEEGIYAEFFNRITRARGEGEATYRQALLQIALENDDAATLMSMLKQRYPDSWGDVKRGEQADGSIKIEREVVEAAEDALEAMDNGQSSN